MLPDAANRTDLKKNPNLAGLQVYSRLDVFVRLGTAGDYIQTAFNNLTKGR